MSARVSTWFLAPALGVTLAVTIGLSAKAGSQTARAARPVSVAAKVHPYKLPDTAVPQSYDLEVTPDLAKAVFDGTVLIELDVTAPTRQLYLNSANLEIKNAVLQQGKVKTSAAVALDKQAERVVLTLPATVRPGNYVLSLQFKGSLNDKLRGFYRSSYKDGAGKTAYMAVTQMEPTDARRMFPCFDEPSFKSRFRVTARIAPSLVAISNAPIEREWIDTASNKKIVRFESTPKMSTYLLALIVGDFKSTEPVNAEGVPVRVWSAGRNPALGNYGRDIAAKVLPYQNSYFKIPYPWKKLDLIAIPDFDAGAMENPGAVTFRESLLLVDGKSASLRSRQAMASVIAHELAHMWFGDLVTMKWWDDLWLNEAFATWMAIKTVAAVIPEWDYMTTFGEERQAAMRTDATKATRAIHAEVNDPAEAQQMFDEITYEKGASVLRMLEAFTGEDNFREGIHRYLKSFSYRNATTADLWASLQEVSGKPVAKMMSAWANQSGYPVVSVAQQNGKVRLSQERFWLRPERTPSKELWNVPVSLRYLNKPASGDLARADQTSLLDARTGELSITDEKAHFTANAGGYGYYRVSYSPPLLKILLPDMTKRLNALERLALVGDQFALCLAGKTSLESYVSVLSACKEETDPDVWDAILDQVRYLNLFVENKNRPNYQKFLRDLLEPTMDRLGWEVAAGDSDKTKMLRGRIISTLGTLGGDEDVIKEARKVFAQYVRTPDSVSPDLVDAITTVVAYNGKDSDFAQIAALWKSAKTPEVEKRNLFALSTFREPALRARVLDMAMKSPVRPQDGTWLIGGVLRSLDGKAAGWEFVQRNWPAISKRFTDHMQTGIASSADQFVEPGQISSIEQFFKVHKIPAGQSSVNRMLERLQVNRQFARQSSAALNTWLASVD